MSLMTNGRLSVNGTISYHHMLDMKLSREVSGGGHKTSWLIVRLTKKQKKASGRERWSSRDDTRGY